MTELDHALFVNLSGFCVFLLFVATLRHYSVGALLPPESLLLLSGVGYGALQSNLMPALPAVAPTPELVIWLLLPLLIFASARNISPHGLASEALPIFAYAGLGVVLTLYLIGVPLALVMGMRVIDGLFFAAAVAATDPSAVAAIFQRFTIPERLSILLEGESMFNDATAIVLFSLVAALALSAEELDLGQALLRFVWSICAAIPLGMGLGWAAGKLVLHWQQQNRFSGLSLTLLLAYGGFVLAEGVLHASGVITVLCSALVFIRVRQGGEAPRDSELFVNFWEYLATLASSILFFALGAAAGAHEFPLTWAIPGVVLILLLARMVVVYGGALLLNQVHTPMPLSWQHVMMLGGLRGAVSAALVLMIPHEYIYRVEMLCLVFVLCLYTLVVHPLLLRFYLRKAPL